MPGGKHTTYSKAQQRTWKRNQRAHPKRGTCRRCGRLATDWAHASPSLSSRTMALCRACHTRRDNLDGLRG
ncbi:MAG: hypothetical protein ACRDLD_02270 [Thermoleophilaceae bacterium]